MQLVNMDMEATNVRLLSKKQCDYQSSGTVLDAEQTLTLEVCSFQFGAASVRGLGGFPSSNVGSINPHHTRCNAAGRLHYTARTTVARPPFSNLWRSHRQAQAGSLPLPSR